MKPRTVMSTWFDTDQIATEARVIVEFENYTIVSGTFEVGKEHEIVFIPDIHGSKEDELAASVDPAYIRRWTFYPVPAPEVFE